MNEESGKKLFADLTHQTKWAVGANLLSSAMEYGREMFIMRIGADVISAMPKGKQHGSTQQRRHDDHQPGC
jgi:hypothetical protein